MEVKIVRTEYNALAEIASSTRNSVQGATSKENEFIISI